MLETESSELPSDIDELGLLSVIVITESPEVVSDIDESKEPESSSDIIKSGFSTLFSDAELSLYTADVSSMISSCIYPDAANEGIASTIIKIKIRDIAINFRKLCITVTLL